VLKRNLRNNNRWYALAIILFISAWLITGWLNKSVTLIVDDQAQTVQTWHIRIGELLHSKGIQFNEDDLISPQPGDWLREGQTVTVEHARPVFIQINDEIQTLITAERDPQVILSVAGLSIPAKQSWRVNGSPALWLPPAPRPVVLEIRQPFTFSVQEGAQFLTYQSTARTFGEALWEKSIRLTAADRLDPPPGTTLTDGMIAQLQRARLVSIIAGEKTISIPTAARTVGEALSAAGMALQGLDYSLPAAIEPVPEHGQIRLVRVTEEVQIEQTPIEFETQYQPAADVEIDNQVILQAGEYGLLASIVRVRYEDGQEVSRQAEDAFISKEPQPRIIGYGTKIVMKTENTPDGPIQYWRVLTMWATSYHPATTSNTTASGLPLQKGVAAVDTRYIPFYTRMYVPGYGEVIAADIGGGVIGRMIDLGYSDEDYVSWHQYVTVYFLWPPPENIVWIIP
jgi:uncharacterized protein YabE (DUF348 family)